MLDIRDGLDWRCSTLPALRCESGRTAEVSQATAPVRLAARAKEMVRRFHTEPPRRDETFALERAILSRTLDVGGTLGEMEGNRLPRSSLDLVAMLDDLRIPVVQQGAMNLLVDDDVRRRLRLMQEERHCAAAQAASRRRSELDAALAPEGGRWNSDPHPQHEQKRADPFAPPRAHADAPGELLVESAHSEVGCSSTAKLPPRTRARCCVGTSATREVLLSRANAALSCATSQRSGTGSFRRWQRGVSDDPDGALRCGRGGATCEGTAEPSSTPQYAVLSQLERARLTLAFRDHPEYIWLADGAPGPQEEDTCNSHPATPSASVPGAAEARREWVMANLRCIEEAAERIRACHRSGPPLAHSLPPSRPPAPCARFSPFETLRGEPKHRALTPLERQQRRRVGARQHRPLVPAASPEAPAALSSRLATLATPVRRHSPPATSAFADFCRARRAEAHRRRREGDVARHVALPVFQHALQLL